MSININKYNDNQSYLIDNNRPADENCVSQVGMYAKYDKKNLVLKPSQVADDEICLVVKDSVDGKVKLVPIGTYDSSSFDSTRYTLKDCVRYGKSFGKHLLIHKDNASTSTIWSDRNRYRLACDTTASGGFSWTVTINGTTKSGTVAWEEGDTLDSIVTQLETGGVATYLVFSHESGEDFIRIRQGGYSNSVFTLSSVTGATLTDLSENCKIDGVLQPATHRGWQAVGLSTLFPTYCKAAPTNVQYTRGGYNLSYRCGCNLAKYKAFYRTSGSATYIEETAVSSRMSEAGFAALASQTGDALALYNKYNGSWDAYMEASMVQINDTHRDGAEYRWYDNGNALGDFLASVTTEDFDGSWIHPFTAANLAATKTDADLGAFCLPTNHEIALFMDDEHFASINKALSVINGTALSISSYYWSVGEYVANSAWFYFGFVGTLNNNFKYYSYAVRPVLASVLED